MDRLQPIFQPNLAGPLPQFMVDLMDRVMARPQRRAQPLAPKTPTPAPYKRVAATPTTAPPEPRASGPGDSPAPKRLRF